MKGFLKHYLNPDEERLNFGLMRREYDDDLITYIVNACKSLEVLQYIEFLGFKYVDDEKDIDLNDYITTRKKTKKKSPIKYMYMQDTRYVELHLKFRITCKGESEVFVKRVLIPTPDDNGYYTIKGKKYFMLYQLVDASTYTTRQNLVLKSLMPVIISRTMGEFEDTEGNLHTAPTYVVNVFKKVKVLLLYFAKLGVAKTLEYFNVQHIMQFVEEERDREKYIYFPISSKILLEIDKHFFQKYQYVQSIALMILSTVSNRLTFDLLENKEYWIERIGSLHGSTGAYNYLERGMTTLTSFNRMLDETTKDVLKINYHNKKSIYSIVRWMIQNYNELRKKDNLDLSNKRLRCNEYIASLLTRELSTRVNRVIAEGNKATLDKVKKIFSFSGDVIMQQLHKSGLLRYDDKINDMDFFSKLKFTLKGPNALGSNNEKNIALKHRGIHPSYLGRIDINVCGTSDPGSSGIITPFCKTDGLYFDGSAEPQGGIFDFQLEAEDYFRTENPDKLFIDVFSGCESATERFSRMDKFRETANKIRIGEIERDTDKMYIRYINKSEDDDI